VKTISDDVAAIRTRPGIIGRTVNGLRYAEAGHRTNLRILDQSPNQTVEGRQKLRGEESPLAQPHRYPSVLKGDSMASR
jgi:hypothetical protein